MDWVWVQKIDFFGLDWVSGLGLKNSVQPNPTQINIIYILFNKKQIRYINFEFIIV